MSRARVSAACAAMSVCLLSVAARAETCPPGNAPPQLTTAVKCEQDPPLMLHMELLAVPERVVSLAFAPLAVVVGVWERYRIVQRGRDFLQNDAGTIVFSPSIDIIGSDGFGAGGKLALISLFGDEERLDFRGLGRVNGEFEAGFQYTHPLAAANGRVLDVRAEYDRDFDFPWFGKDHQRAGREHALRRDVTEVAVAFDLSGRGAIYFTGTVEAWYRRERLGPGESDTVPNAKTLDPLGVPAGFGHTYDFPGMTLRARLDTRDSAGHPTRGIVATLDTSVTGDVNEANLSAVAVGGSLKVFLPVLPDKRTLQLAVGGRGTAPLNGDHRVPFHALTVLGREHHMRGFARSRFRDRHGWWSTLEYRFPLYEYRDTGIGATAAIFFDVGSVAPTLDTLFDNEPRVSGGVVLRAAHDTVRIFDLHLGVSSEGVEVGLRVGRF